MDNAQVVEDFRRRWQETYVWLKMKGKGIETLVFVRQVEHDESKVGVLHLESADYGSMTINLGSSDHSLMFRYPKSGVFQHGSNACYFHRRPARQWRRGICSDNSTLSTTMRHLGGPGHNMSINTVSAAFKHKTYPIGEALQLLDKRMARSVALENNFSIALSPTQAKEHLLLFWTDPVARVTADGKLATLYEEVMEANVNEVLHGS